MTEITDHVCFEMDRGFVCNQPPDHEGDHIAKALLIDGSTEEKYEVHRWPRAGKGASAD